MFKLRSERGQGEAIAILIIGLVVAFACVAVGAMMGGLGDTITEDRAEERRVEMREYEMEQAKAERGVAEAETEAAEARLEEARQEKEIEEARARQDEADVAWQTAYGQRMQDEADAYNTRRMSDAAYKAIQRQGHLLSLSVGQQMFFGGVSSIAALIFGVLAFIEIAARRRDKAGYTIAYLRPQTGSGVVKGESREVGVR